MPSMPHLLLWPSKCCRPLPTPSQLPPVHIGPHTPCALLQCLVLAAKDDAQRKEQLVLVNTRLLALCTAHDSVAADTEKLEAAAEVYRDLLSSVSGRG